MTKKEQKILDILKSGNFTIAYHDNGYCTLYVSRFKDYESVSGKDFEFPNVVDGYMTVEVVWLVKALGGEVVSV